MRRALALTLSIPLSWYAACGSDDGPLPAVNVEAGAASDAAPDTNVGSTDAADPRCLVEPTFITTHAHAAAETTPIAQDLIDVRGWRGRLYFAYGDLDQNTGPVIVSSFEPKTKNWQDHLTFDTERVERFHAIGDLLWAPAADPRGAAPDPEYAVGTADHVWRQVDIGASLHVMDAIERVPGEVLLTGSAWIDVAQTRAGGTVWRSLDGGPFDRIFPTYDDAGKMTLGDPIYVPFSGAALAGTAYMTGLGPGWMYDGGTWSHGAAFNDFLRPVSFAGQLVYASGGELWSSADGVSRRRLDFLLLETPQPYQFVIEPLPIYQATEGHLIAVDRGGVARETTDLVTWRCLGKAPADVRSIGSLDGVVYFGAAAGRVYGYAQPSW